MGHHDLETDNLSSDHFKQDGYIRSATEAANVALWSICPATRETWFSKTWYTLLGFETDAFEPSFEQFIGMMHPDDAEGTQTAYTNLVEGRTDHYAADFRLKAADGTWRWVGASGSKVERPNGMPYIIYGMQMDITARKRTEQALEETAHTAEEHRSRLARLAENSPAALFEFKIDLEGTVTLPYITAGVHEILGVPAQEVQDDGVAVFKNIFDEDMETMGPTIEESQTNLTPFRMRYRVRRPDVPAGFVWVQANSVPHREADGSTVWFGSIYDISPEVEREAMLADARDAMRHLALHDGLTSLPNRRYFDDAIKERETAVSDREPNAVLIRIDLDRFKYVNDTLGHAAGDAVLRHIAGILRDVSQKDDLPSRIGGDEFCMLMRPHASVADAIQTVNDIQNALKSPFFFEGKICRFGASFGIASSEQGDISNGDLMSFADAALYQAKAAGRGRLEVFSSAMHTSILEARRIAADIESAIENGEFEPFFHPQICARTGKIHGAEVLARWRKPDGSLILPDQFMAVAEQIRAVPLIDKFMVDQTLEAVRAWKRDGIHIPKLSFNVSAGRLQEVTLVSAVQEIQSLGIRVAFELLESILLEDSDNAAIYNIDLARDAGIEIEVDDFGTGHASILGLLKVKPDVLKIDRRLTQGIVEDAQSRDLVLAIIGIARSLGISIVAEGVETNAQANLLADLGCDVFQGFLFSEPLSRSHFNEWVVQEQSWFPGRVA